MSEKYLVNEKKFSNLILRRDYNKVSVPSNFEEPNLLEIQKKSYDRFLNIELKKIISSFFPISHENNEKFELRFNNII
jgi:DNA-directed RNA polymerase subunit beta